MDVKIPVFYLSDCANDSNGLARLLLKTTAAFSQFKVAANVHVLGVKNNFELAINIVDLVGLVEEQPVIIMANAAPRKDINARHNGCYFGYVKIGSNIIAGTVGGFTFSLLQKMLGNNQLTVNCWDIPKVAPVIAKNQEEADEMITTQFRSLYFFPKAVAALVAEKELPTTVFNDVPKIGSRIAYIDDFGNIKTTLTLADLPTPSASEKNLYRIQVGQVNYNIHFFPNGLTSMPEGLLGLTIGSSGWHGQRLLELIIKSGDAAGAIHAKLGDEITLSTPI